jgi:fatty-acid desaturase
MYVQIASKLWSFVVGSILIIILSAVSAWLITHRQMRIIENKGIATDFIKKIYWPVFLTALIIFATIALYFGSTSLFFSHIVALAFVFFASFPVISQLTSILVYRKWEHKNNKILFKNKNKIFTN